MEINFKVYIITLLYVLVFCQCHITAQDNKLKFEKTSINYLCDYLIYHDEKIKQLKISFNGVIQNEYGNIYNILNTIGKIDLLKDSIPNKDIIDIIHAKNSKFLFNKQERIKCYCDFLKRKKCFKKYVFKMYVYHSVLYEKYNYVEIYLLNKLGHRVTIVIQLDENYKIINYFVNHLVT